MSAIGKGDWVECICTDELGLTVAGRVYRVHSLVARTTKSCGHDGCREVAIALHEASPKPHWRGFCINRFRPIYHPKASFIESLKAPAPSDPVPP